MANKKFSEFTVKTSTSDVDFVVGYDGTDNVRITPANLTGGGGASDLNGLSDCLVDTDSVYLAEVPSSLSGNPQGNLVVGVDAGNALTSGFNNTLLGNDAGKALTTSASNVIIGKNAGLAKTSGSNATIIGTSAGRDTASGSNVVLIGSEAGISNTGNNAIAIGFEAGRVNGIQHTLSIGRQAGYSNTFGDRNVYLGYRAGYSNTTSEQNTSVGYQAGAFNTGSYNVSIGTDSGRDHTGAKNVVIGAGAGTSMTTSDNNIVIGYDAEPSTATIDNEITLGDANITSFRIPGLQSGASNGDVLTFNSSAGKLELQAAGGGGASSLNGLSDCLVDTLSLYVGESPSSLSGNPQGNATLGIDSGNALTTGNSNTLIGSESGKLLTTQQQNVFLGSRAGLNQVASYNNIIGYEAGLGSASSTSGATNNNFMGWRAGYSIQDGTSNTFIGTYAGRAQQSGDNNIAIGHSALYNDQGSNYNIAIGKSAMANYNNTGSQRNTVLGHLAASNMNTNKNCTLIGYNVQPSSGTVQNEITLGSSSITALRCAVTSITSLSDERDKSEIKDLEYGLAFIDALQPREFVWDNRPEIEVEIDDEGNQIETEFYSANKGKKDFGFIAQEVRELDNDTLRLVYTENEEKLEMSYGKLVPILVKAIQELKEEVELLKS